MATPESGESRPMSFRDVPWRWRHAAIAFLPTLLILPVPHLLSPRIFSAQPRWLWIVLTSLNLAWMVAYPLRVAGLVPAPPSLRRLWRESVIALAAVPIVMLTLGVIALFLSRWLVKNPSPFEAIAGAPEWYQSAALAILAVFAAPLAEEVLFRGMLYNLLRRRLPVLPAAVIQGAAFGFLHPFGLLERVVLTIMGVFLALLYNGRKTLAAPILFHSINNAAAIGILFYAMALAAIAPVLGVRGEPHEKGCQVAELVPGGAADEAGLRVGDVITAAGEDPVRDLADLVQILRSKKVGDRIPVRFTRDGQEHTVEATLKARPE